MKIQDLKAVFIEAGHGLSANGKSFDNGAVSGGTNERKEVVEISNQLLTILREDKNFDKVEIVEVGVNERMTLSKKISFINNICKKQGFNSSNSLLVSLHINAGGGQGLETWYYGGSDHSKTYATNLINGVQKSTKLKYRNAPVQPDLINRWGRLAIVRDTIPNACLLELGFIDNIHDMRVLSNPDNEDLFTKGIFNGFLSYLSLNPNPRDVPLTLTDIDKSQWFYEDVMKMINLGIMSGYPDNTFKPANPVNRVELSAIISRLLKLLNK